MVSRRRSPRAVPPRRAGSGAAPLLGAFACIVLPAASLAGADRHAGHYYPEHPSREVYESRASPLPDSDRRRRIGFVTELTRQMLANPYPPRVAIFAKGTRAEKLIITSLHDGSYDTLFRLRALLAMLTARARASPAFQDNRVADVFTFLDLLKLLGFEQVTLTDGRRLAHQIELRERPGDARTPAGGSDAGQGG